MEGRVDISKYLWSANPFLYIGIIVHLEEDKEIGLPLYKVFIFDEGRLLGVANEVSQVSEHWAVDFWNIKKLRPTKHLIKRNGGKIEKKPITESMSLLSKGLGGIFQENFMFDGDIVLVGFIFGKVPVILGALPVRYAKYAVMAKDKKSETNTLFCGEIDGHWYKYEVDKGILNIEGKKNSKFTIESQNNDFEVNFILKNENKQERITLNFSNKNNIVSLISGTERWTFNIKDINNDIKLSNTGIDITTQKDTNITVKGKAILSITGDTTITSSGTVVIDGTAINIGNAVNLANNLPSCLFTGAPHSPGNVKTKV